ncbi:MAG: penicillin-binding protein 2 [bacterium]
MKSWRINLILIFIIFLGLGIIGRLFYLQISQYDLYKALAKGQQKFFTQIEGSRGEIVCQDKKGNLYPLAINEDWQLAYASPQEVKDKSATADSLTQILGLEKDFILDKLNKDGLYELLKNKLNKEEVAALKEANLTGIYLGEERGRQYPLEKFASSLIGFVGGEKSGQYGLEEYWEETLRGKEKFIEGEKSSKGYSVFFDTLNNSAQEGADLILNIDYNIQYFAEKLLAEAYESLNIEEGQIVVMDPTSGKILALASWPGFNPNEYSTQEMATFQNGTVQKIFEPGSVFKPITMAIALNEGKITPETTYYDKGIIQVGGYTIHNYNDRAWGECSMTEVLERSINTGAVFAANQISNETFLKYVDNFKLFEPTGIDLSGEVFSTNQSFKKGYEINFANASFGQGIEMTPVQLMQAYSAFANNGKMIKPYVVETIMNKTGGKTEIKPEIDEEPVISPETARKVTEMLVSVIENGFSKAARIPGYYIAGKTGTSQVSYSALGINQAGYSEKTIQSFIGYAPAFDPRFLMLVKLDNPQTRTAEYSAMPVWRDLAKYIIDYYQIPPDYEE